MLVFIFMLGLLVGLGIAAGIIQLNLKPALQSKTTKSIIAPPNPPETRGYAFNSFDYVSKRLPAAPPGYMWEHKISTIEDEVWQKLGLLRISDEKVIKDERISLTYYGKSRWKTWAEYKRDYSCIHKIECIKNSDSLIEFAQKIVDDPKFNPDSVVDKYELKA